MAETSSASGAPRARGVLEAEARALVLLLGLAVTGAATERHQVLAEHHQRARRDDAGQRLGDAQLAHVRLDRPIEGEVLGERVDEHERVVDVGAYHRLLRTRTGEAQPPLGAGAE